MRKLVAFAALMAFIGGTQLAAAADLSYKDTPYEAPLAPIWGGLYVGGHVGGLWQGDDSLDLQKRCKDSRKCKCRGCDDTEWKDVEKHRLSSDKDDDVSLLGGLYLGYNIQSGSLVYGIEGDVSFADSVDYLASLRARLGLAIDNFLIYATAGVAFAGMDDSQIFWGNHQITDNDDNTRVGLVVGGGVEYKIRPNWSIGAEALYYAFKDDSDSLEWENFCKEYKLSHEDDSDLFVVRARLSYHFQDAYDEPLK